ncbi:glycosyltransferase family 2 protein [Pseudarthrobacter oxydans]|uniref:glycosyltransferase family 2 protein n=1 Tax=Pseudarthrobacter oxydans TaxID=1671 RepID=UPI0038304A40
MTEQERTGSVRGNRVGAVVVTYNSSADIHECLASLVAAGVDDILVLDNGSKRDEVTATSSVCSLHSQVEFHASPANMGFGAGVNQAVRLLPPCEFLWIINPDTVADKGSVAALKSVLLDGKYDIVSPQISTGEAGDPTIWFDGGSLDLVSLRTQHHGIGNVVQDPSGENIDCTFLTGCALFMRFETWKALGGFSERFFLYWEDAELSWRATQQGMSLGVTREARIFHSVGGSGDRSGKSPVYFYYMQRNRLLFANKLHIGHKVFTGAGLLETLRLTMRPLRQKTKPVEKFLFGIRGLIAGVNAIVIASKRDIKT